MRERPINLHSMALAALALVGLIVAGTVGFMEVLDEGAIAALYRTIIILSTLGLATVPESSGAQVLTILLLLAGVATYLYVFSSLIELTVAGTLTGALQERRVHRHVEHLEDHYIVCGYGRMGRYVAEELRSAGAGYVVVDTDGDAVAEARARGEDALEGSATEDSVLHEAGIERARGLIACVGSDADNLYVTLSARAARPDLLVVARASDDEAAKKLRLAGANRVVEPYSTVGREMGKLVLRPQVAVALDISLSGEGSDLRVEEIEVPSASEQSGQALRDLSERTGAVVVGIGKPDGTFEPTPGPETVVGDGDVLVAVGTAEELHALEELFRPRERVAG